MRAGRYSGVNPFTVLVVGLILALLLGAVPSAPADAIAQLLPFSQDWSNTNLITIIDDWSGVPGITGYRGDGLTSANDVDPQTVLTEGSPPVDVNANQTNPSTFTTGGVAEFHIANPTLALQGSGTADAPSLLISLNTLGFTNITMSYNLRDIDGSADNAVQQVALHYRVGNSGNFTNVPAGYVADATTGPSLATLVTPVNVVLPGAVENVPLIQLRIITTNASGSDEWVGVDDISITGTPLVGDTAPSVSSTTPANSATNVPANANIFISFSEAVSVTGNWFEISCSTSSTHTAGVSGGPQTFTLNPTTDFASNETCTVTIFAAQVTDQDADDPPDNMAANFSFSFMTESLVLVQINAIQGAGHISPLVGEQVTTTGIVTAKTSSSFWMQNPTPDANPATSEGLLVFGSSAAATVAVGDHVEVHGTVTEFRPGCTPSCPDTSSAFANLTTTELTGPSVTKLPSGSPLPAATVIGVGGRVPPTMVIEDDATPPPDSVETSGVFDPATDGIDFYESLEGMRVQVNNAVAVGPRNQFGEIPVLADNGAGAGVRTARGGIVIRANDFNPERIFLDDVLAATPVAKVGDRFAMVVGVMDYSFGNFKLLVTATPALIDGGLLRETTRAPADSEIAVATYNVENLNPNLGAAIFERHARIIVENLRSPDLLAMEEIQDNDGVQGGTASTMTDASVTWNTLITAIKSVGGPDYQFRQIDPIDDADGGVPGGNIRVGFLFRTDRGLTFIDRPGGTATTPATVVSTPSGPRLSVSPGRIDPGNNAWSTPEGVRKPLVGEFRAHGKKLFVIANHWKSKSGDQPLFGRFQPPTLVTQAQRVAEAQVVRDFVSEILALDPNANVIVLGDLNDFEFSAPLTILKDSGDLELHALIETLSPEERYSYVFEGNSQVLDHIFVSNNLLENFAFTYDVVHVNSEFPDQASDHEPQVVFLDLRGRPSPKP